MKHNKQNLDAIIDAAAREIREEQIDEAIINQSATHVWARISQQMTSTAATLQRATFVLFHQFEYACCCSRTLKRGG